MRNSKSAFWQSLVLSIVLLFSVCFGSALADEASNNKSSKIIGGVEASPGAWPWMGVLVTAGGELSQSFYCGASLIGSKWIVTAAHCVNGISASSIEVVLGVHNLATGSGERHTVKKIYVHPSYNSFSEDSDIALLELNESSSFQPISLVDAGMNIDGYTATVIGWGNMSATSSNYPDVLQQVEVPVVTNDECNENYSVLPWYDNPITDTMVCAGYDQGGKDSCQGDSGGPMMISHEGAWKLAGVVSWGEGCARPNFFGVYSRVSALRDFIDETIAEGDSGSNLAVYIPHITALAQDWKDYLQVDNPGNTAATITISLYNSGVLMYEQPHQVPGKTKSLIVLKDLTEYAQFGKITYTDPGLTFRLSTENISGTGAAEIFLSNELSSSLNCYFSDFLSLVAWKGLVITNFSNTTATLTLTAIGNGATLGQTTVTLGSYFKTAGLHASWFPGVSVNDIDWISITSSNGDLCGLTVSGTADSATLVMVPGVPEQ